MIRTDLGSTTRPGPRRATRGTLTRYTLAAALAPLLLGALVARAQFPVSPPSPPRIDPPKVPRIDPPAPPRVEPPPTPDLTLPAKDSRRPFTQDIKGTTVSFQMTPIPGGTAPDGTALNPFYIATTEITWDVYDVWVFSLDVPEGGADASTRPTKPYLLMDRGFGHASYPAISMSYKGAQEFCRWLSEKTGRTYRVPTDAEWEYACRAGSKSRYPFGDDAAGLADNAWWSGNAELKTHPVGTKKPNAWGVHDMLGNAGEWVTARDGSPKLAGGCFRDDGNDITPAAHVEPVPEWNASDPQIPKSVWWLADGGFITFRVVCTDGHAK